ncbi:MAG: hypothetical protein ACTHJ8_14330 [Mucilaginibacter sp.]
MQKIEDLLLDEEQVLPFRYYKRPTEFRHDDRTYKQLYRVSFVDFPVEVVPASGEILLSHDSLINYHTYHAIRNKTSDHILQKQTEETTDQSRRELIDSMISERLMNLYYEFELTLKRAHKSYYFAGITDNATIIRNVLNLYQNVRKDESLQIAHLGHIKLPKSIADIITDIYITFLSDRLAMLELREGYGRQMMATVNDDAKLTWNGKQQHLVELYLLLEQKGWINKNDLSKNRVAALLCQFFDLTYSKKKPNSNSVESIYQLLKGETGERYEVKYFYDQPKYIKQFDGIKRLRSNPPYFALNV